MAENFNEHDENYVKSSIVEAGILLPSFFGGGWRW